MRKVLITGGAGFIGSHLAEALSEVYGKPDRPAFSEEGDLALGPTPRARWRYAASTIIDEFVAKARFEARGLPTVTARLFNTTGPRRIGNGA